MTYHELSSIADSITYKNPITDPEVIQFIRGNKRLKKLFVRSYLSNGKRILIYNPNKTKKINIKKIKPAYKTVKASKKPKPVLMIPKPSKVVWINYKKYVEEWSFSTNG